MRLSGGPGRAPARVPHVLIGGAGFVGSSVAATLRAAGVEVVVVDHRPPSPELRASGVTWVERDVLVDELVPLADGRVVICLGCPGDRRRWSWTAPLDMAIAAARLAPALAGRDVVLVSALDAAAHGVHDASMLDDWCDSAVAAAAGPCPPWRVAGLCRRLAEAAGSDDRVHALATAAQERIVARAVPAAALTVLRIAEPVGVGHEGYLVGLVRRALAGLDLVVAAECPSFVLAEDVGRAVAAHPGPGTWAVAAPPVDAAALARAVRASCGSHSPLRVTAGRRPPAKAPPDVRPAAPDLDFQDVLDAVPMLARRLSRRPPLFPAGLQVVVPPRPVRPDVVADRQQACLWSGAVKAGNRWSSELAARLRERLGLSEAHRLLVTTSGTAAIRIATTAVAGPARRGEAALVPSFTFPATAEAVAQLGYEVRFADVDPDSWTLDVADVEAALSAGDVGLVVAVDTFGNPADYGALAEACRAHGAALVGDSAAAIGSLHGGHAVGTQADAHAFSMSFAKSLTAAGAGGLAVVPVDADLSHWTRSALMGEVHAVSALDQLDALDDLIARRGAVARTYADALAAWPTVRMQSVAPADRHSYVHFVVRVPRAARSAVMEELGALGIATRDYFRALHRDGWPSRRALPETARLHDEVMALPMSSELSAHEAQLVALGCELALRRASAEHEELLAGVGHQRLLA